MDTIFEGEPKNEAVTLHCIFPTDEKAHDIFSDWKKQTNTCNDVWNPEIWLNKFRKKYKWCEYIKDVTKGFDGNKFFCVDIQINFTQIKNSAKYRLLLYKFLKKAYDKDCKVKHVKF